MPGKMVRANTSLALTLLTLLLLFAGCGRNYRQIVIVDNGKAEYVTVGRGPKKNPKIWAPGRVLAFRTTSTVPDAPGNVTGTAGHVYRIGDDMKLEEVAEFQNTVPSDSLAYTYGK
jgi:hypothetical protein